MSAASLPVHWPAAVVVPCPGCGNPMGDGDRVLYGRCGACRRRARFGRCWCRRPIAADAPADVMECAEHAVPIPASAQAPADPLTPGGVFAATHDCPRCGQRNVDHDVAPGGLICPPSP